MENALDLPRWFRAKLRKIRVGSALSALDRDSVDRLPAGRRHRASPRQACARGGANPGRKSEHGRTRASACGGYRGMPRSSAAAAGARCSRGSARHARAGLDATATAGARASWPMRWKWRTRFVLGVDPSAACVACAEALATHGRARRGRRVVKRLAFARGCFGTCARRASEDASFDVVIVNSVTEPGMGISKGTARGSARLPPDGFLYHAGVFADGRPLPTATGRRLRAQATCSAPLALKRNSPASPWIAGFSRALSSAGAPSNPTAPTTPPERAARRRSFSAIARARHSERAVAAFDFGAPVVVCPLREMPENACERRRGLVFIFG